MSYWTGKCENKDYSWASAQSWKFFLQITQTEKKNSLKKKSESGKESNWYGGWFLIIVPQIKQEIFTYNNA